MRCEIALLVMAILMLATPVSADVNDELLLWEIDTGDRIDRVWGSHYATFDGLLIVFREIDGDYLNVGCWKHWESIHVVSP